MEEEGNAMASRPNPKAPLGEGGRFAAVEASARASGAKDPAAVAAAVGRKKYGAKRMAALAARGRAPHGSGIFAPDEMRHGYRVR
jgi:hypothetical protein